MTTVLFVLTLIRNTYYYDRIAVISGILFVNLATDPAVKSGTTTLLLL
jgi:hypothetical protein